MEGQHIRILRNGELAECRTAANIDDDETIIAFACNEGSLRRRVDQQTMIAIRPRHFDSPHDFVSRWINLNELARALRVDEHMMAHSIVLRVADHAADLYRGHPRVRERVNHRIGPAMLIRYLAL